MELDQAHINILKEHLPYELTMLEQAFSNWVSLSPSDDFFRQNSVIEVFWLHARNIHEFFKTNQDRTASADHFTRTPLTYDFSELDNKETMMHDQIAHLNYDRTTDALNKLDIYFALRVKGAVDRAVKNFQDNLCQAAKDHWNERSPMQIEIPNSESVTSSSYSTFYPLTIGAESD